MSLNVENTKIILKETGRIYARFARRVFFRVSISPRGKMSARAFSRRDTVARITRGAASTDSRERNLRGTPGDTPGPLKEDSH